MAHPLWPLFDLRIRTLRLELRLPTDDDLAELAAVVAGGIHDRAVIPFYQDWTDRDSPELEQEFARYHWRVRSEVRPERWSLPLAVVAGGTVMGLQDIGAVRFAQVRAVTTGSWLGRRFQSRGFGTEMRAAVLEWAFVHLGALEAHSAARTENHASLGVSGRLGYEPNGTNRVMMGDQVVVEQRFRLDPDRWRAYRPDLAVEVEGMDQCRALLGA